MNNSLGASALSQARIRRDIVEPIVKLTMGALSLGKRADQEFGRRLRSDSHTLVLGISDLLVASNSNCLFYAINLHLVAKPVLRNRRVEIAIIEAKIAFVHRLPNLAIVKNEKPITVTTFLARRHQSTVLNAR